MKRLTLFVILLVSGITAWGQNCTQLVMGEFQTVDVREFAASLDWEVPGQTVMSRRAPAGAGTTWIDRIHNLPQYMRDFYEIHRHKVQEVLDGGSNYLSDPENDNTNVFRPYGDDRTYMVLNVFNKTIEYTFPDSIDFTDPYAKRQFAIAAINQDVRQYYDEATNFMPYMFMSMSYDFPQAFWIGNYYSWGAAYNMGWDFIQQQGRDSVEYDYILLYSIKTDDFDYRIDQFRTAGAVADAVTEYKGIVDDILADLPTTSRYEQIRYLNNWLTKHNAYSSAYTSGNFSPIVWSPISALRGTNGAEGPVCEGYARAFKILCDKIGIPCILAVGNAFDVVGGTPESHMWDEVQMTDNNWYAVDVTWNDPTIGGIGINDKVSGAENEKWLLLGKNDIVSENLTFAQSHPNSLVFGQGEEKFWDYDNETLIADSKFDPVTGIGYVGSAFAEPAIYSILGVKLDKKVGELEPGLYIINGKKVAIR